MKKCLKRVMALFMTSSLLLSGCGAAESADDRKQETEGTETVELTVWGEKDNTATLTKMIDSFKEQYKGQADFNITLETQADSGVRDVMLTRRGRCIFVPGRPAYIACCRRGAGSGS